jgi:hypothetical protein
VKELIALLQRLGDLLKDKFKTGAKTGEAPDRLIRRADQPDPSRLDRIRERIRAKIPATVDSVEKDILEANVHNVILAMANLLGGLKKLQP